MSKIKKDKFFDDDGTPDEDIIDEIRFKEHEITFNNQDILELAYTAKDFLETLLEHNSKLSFCQANSCMGTFYTIRELIKLVDDDYLAEFHQRLIDFYDRDIEIISDRLYWKDEIQDKYFYGVN